MFKNKVLCIMIYLRTNGIEVRFVIQQEYFSIKLLAMLIIIIYYVCKINKFYNLFIVNPFSYVKFFFWQMLHHPSLNQYISFFSFQLKFCNKHILTLNCFFFNKDKQLAHNNSRINYACKYAIS